MDPTVAKLEALLATATARLIGLHELQMSAALGHKSACLNRRTRPGVRSYRSRRLDGPGRRRAGLEPKDASESHPAHRELHGANGGMFDARLGNLAGIPAGCQDRSRSGRNGGIYDLPSQEDAAIVAGDSQHPAMPAYASTVAAFAMPTPRRSRPRFRSRGRGCPDTKPLV